MQHHDYVVREGVVKSVHVGVKAPDRLYYNLSFDGDCKFVDGRKLALAENTRVSFFDDSIGSQGSVSIGSIAAQMAKY